MEKSEASTQFSEIVDPETVPEPSSDIDRYRRFLLKRRRRLPSAIRSGSKSDTSSIEMVRGSISSPSTKPIETRPWPRGVSPWSIFESDFKSFTADRNVASYSADQIEGPISEAQALGADSRSVSDIFLVHANAQRDFVLQLRRGLGKENISVSAVSETSMPLEVLFLLRFLANCKVVIIVLSEECLRSTLCMMVVSAIVESRCSPGPRSAMLPLFFKISERVMLPEADEKGIKDYVSDWKRSEVSDLKLEEWLGALRTISKCKGLRYNSDESLEAYIDAVLERTRLLLLGGPSEDPQPVGLDEVYAPPSNKFRLENKHYDVYLSFRGLDVRILVDHLVESLSTAGVRVFSDNERLEKGGSSYLSLKMAIEDTAIHIPIFSRNYAGSVWCLKEVTQMSRSRGFIVPLYYDVEPADVRDPDTGVYAEAFKIHHGQGRYNGKTIAKWKRALKKVHSVSRPPVHGTPGHEGDLVKSMVWVVLEYLKLVPLEVTSCAVGLKKQMDNVINLLEIDRDFSKKLVVIWGMGGIGKTTLAKAVYNSILRRFEAACFISDVQTSAQGKNGLCQLQRQLLRDLVGIDLHVERVRNGKALMKAHLLSTRALVILDGVDKQQQFDALWGDWFGNGSRIIVTTRDMGILKCTEVVKTYTVVPLNNDEALQLFSWHAFGRAVPDEGYESLSQKVVNACGGLPLSLEIIGSVLHRQRDLTCWTQCSKGLESYVMWEDPLFRTLKISYDSLSYQEKQMFLDIACFFVAEGNLETAKIFWECLGFAAETALSNLIGKSLLSVNDKNQFLMHIHLQEMGRAIIAKESEDPGKRSRLWKADDALQVIEKSLGTGSVCGISIGISRSEKNNIILRAEGLASVPNLHLLWLDGLASIEGDLQKLSPNLRWLRWSSCPWKCLPSEWNIEHLSVLDLSSGGQGFPSYIKELWNENLHYRKSKSLKVLRLNSCEYFERLPDLSNYPSLSILDLEHCSELRTVHDSIGLLLQLKYLNLSGCKNLEELPESIGELSSLERLFLRNCFSMRMLPNALGELETLKELDMQCLGLVQELPPLQKLSCLERLDLSDCHSLRILPISMGELKCLQYLNINGCCSLSCLPEDFGNLVSLEELFMNYCCRLRELPQSFGNLVNLRNLEMKCNSNLMGLPASFYHLDLLMRLDASDCNLLHGFSEQIGDLSSLEILNLENNLFCSLPSSISNLLRLTKLILNKCETLLELPVLPEGLAEVDIGNCMQLKTIGDMSHLEKLKTLVICNCEHLVRLPELGCGQSLTMLNISGCKNVRSLGDVERLKSLQTFYLTGSGVSVLNLQQWMKDMPDLQELSIYANRVPEWLQYKMQDHFLKDNDVKEIFPSTMLVKRNICAGVIFCCILKFFYRNNAGGSVSEDPMELSIVGSDGQVFFKTKVFSNRQKVEGDQLYMCVYRENHPLIMRLASADSMCVQVKGSNIQIRDGGIQLLYTNDLFNDGTVDVFERLERDLRMLEENYNEDAGKDEFDMDKDEFQCKEGEQDNDDESYEYGYVMSEGEYQTDKD